ncbi:MAG: MFS transporter [Micropepsaceae bacterium]
MAFLQNRSVNLINIHYGFQALAQGSGGVFLLVFLLRAGLSVTETLLALAGTVMVRFISRMFVLSVAKRFGLKSTLIFGSFVLALQYPLSAEIHGLDLALAGRCLATGIGEAFYWSCFHAYFASLGDAEHRGHQVGAREALASAIGIAAPLLGSWALVSMGPRIAFLAIGLAQAASAIPLLWTPEVGIRDTAPGSKAASRLGVQLYVANGWFSATFILIWQIALFLALGESLSAYGGTMALAAVAGAIGGLLLGRGIDGGHGARSVIYVFGAITMVAILRAASLDTAELAVAANALGAFAICFYVPTLMAPVYNLAKASPCSLRFHIAAENGWDVGCFVASVFAAALHAAGLPLSVAILMTVFSSIAHIVLLRSYYQQKS